MIYDLVNGYQLGLAVLLVLTILYYRKFKQFKLCYKSDYDVKKKKIGQTLPPHPNGWFVACRSGELAKGEVKSIEFWGEHIALFRGDDGKAYALDAYCAHMGANIGILGKVKYGSCIQCPFHGWAYDGETGACVDHNKKPLRGISAEYDESIGSRDSKVVFHKCETDIKLRKYPVRELNHLVHVWIHSDPKREPEYDLLNVEWLQQELSYRGVAENRIHCHIQDIAENGADIMHFYYVHKYLVSAWKWFYVNWLASWVRLDSEDIKGKFTHTLKNVDEFKKRIYENMVKGNKDGKYIGNVNVDAYINLPFLKEFFGWNITVFQVGSGVVYIIVKSYFFTALYIQFIQTEGKFTQHAYHQMYISKWMPYWMSAVFLHLEAQQVYNDTLVWDAKQFKRKAMYQKNPADNNFMMWREWYGQFYEGCNERGEKSLAW